jgi:hypothetical protein
MSCGEFRRARWDVLQRRQADIEQTLRTWDATPGASAYAQMYRLRRPIIIFVPRR